MLEPTLAMVDMLAVFPLIFLKEKLSGLKHELPLYLSTIIVDLADCIDCLDWWKIHAKELPMWSDAARLILLVQPSSAASERVFSILNSSFKHQQNHSLQDYVETSLMLQYNKH